MKQPEQKVVWKPFRGTSQENYIVCPFPEKLFSGTRGNGKTESAIIDFTQHCGKGYGAFWKGIIFRHTYKELDDVVAKGKRLLIPLGAKWKKSASEYKFVFPDGEELMLRHAKEEDDYWNYHGQEYPFIHFEELTKWRNLKVYNAFKSLNRATVEGMPRIYSANTNPYGAGHGAVKTEWIDPAPEMSPHGQVLKPCDDEIKEPFTKMQADTPVLITTFMFCGYVDGEWRHYKKNDTDLVQALIADGEEIYQIRGRIDYWVLDRATNEWDEINYTNFEEINRFIADVRYEVYPSPPRIRFDGDIMENEFIVNNDPEYIEKLNSIKDPQLKKAWRFGDWDVNVGAFFHGYLSKENNMVKPFMPPVEWKRWKAYDWGSNKPWSIGYYAICPEGVIYRYRELYGWTGEPDKGSGETWAEICEMMDVAEEAETKMGCKFWNNPADHNIFIDQGHEKDIAELMAQEGHVWIKATKGRRSVGWDLMKQLFKDGMLKITADCTNFWRTVPELMTDDKNWEDLDSAGEDHIADEMRYSVVSRHKTFANKGKNKQNNTTGLGVADDDALKTPINTGRFAHVLPEE